MAPPRVQKRATTHVRTPRVYLRSVELLTRVRAGPGNSTSQTLHFSFPRKTGGARRSAVEFVRVEDVPEFDGEEAWFEVEKVQRGNGRAWPFWRAVRQAEPPADA